MVSNRILAPAAAISDHEVADRGEHMLAVVQHEQSGRRLQPAVQRGRGASSRKDLHPQRRGDDRTHPFLGGDAGQVAPPRDPLGGGDGSCEGGLAHAARADNGDAPVASREDANLLNVVVPADEPQSRLEVGDGNRGQAGRFTRRITGDVTRLGMGAATAPRRVRRALEDVALRFVQLWGRVEPQLFGQRTPVDRVDSQGVGRGTELVQRPHQQQGRSVAQRLLGDELAQLVRRLACAAQREEHLCALLARRRVRLLQTQSLALGDVGGQPCPGGSAPQGERLVVRRQPTGLLEGARPPQPGGKAVGVDVHPRQVEPVADSGAPDARALRAKRTTSPTDSGMQGCARIDGQILPPHDVDEAVVGDDPTPGHEQACEQPSRAACREGKLTTANAQVRVA